MTGLTNDITKVLVLIQQTFIVYNVPHIKLVIGHTEVVMCPIVSSQNSYVEVLTPVYQKVTVFGEALKEAIRLK